MRACGHCKQVLPENSAPQRKFCEDPDCKRERDARRKAAQRERKQAEECRKYGEFEVGECMCGAYVRLPRQWWKVRPTRLLGASPNIDIESSRAGVGSGVRSSRTGQLLISHAAGPVDEDIYTLTTVSGDDTDLSTGTGATRPSRSYGDPNRVWRDVPEGLKRSRKRRGRSA